MYKLVAEICTYICRHKKYSFPPPPLLAPLRFTHIIKLYYLLYPKVRIAMIETLLSCPASCSRFQFFLYRSFEWSLCPTGYYLSGFYRTDGNKLYDITHAWCCKPKGASESNSSCYDENVSLKFEWYQMEIVSCSRSGYYITGLYRSGCDYLHCIERFRCCKLHIVGKDNHFLAVN